MNPIRRFEDIEAWKLARRLANDVYEATNAGEFVRDFALKNQIRRAAVSIVSNIAEGFERDGNKEFIQFLFIAKGSCGEVRAQLYLAQDRHYLDSRQFDELFRRTVELSRIISGLIKYLKRSPMTGTKYRQI